MRKPIVPRSRIVVALAAQRVFTSTELLIVARAAILPRGALRFRAQKAFPMLPLNAAVAARGPAFFPFVFALHASIKAESFDELKSIRICILDLAISSYRRLS